MHSATAQAIREINGVDLCVEDLGAREDPPLLLVAGASSSMDFWEDDFCDLLVEGGRRVIRYDHRDTGRSIAYDPGAPGYGFDDLVADAVGVLDALGLARAHVAGISMGGAIAQVMALDHPRRVASLTLIATSPAGAHAPDLPPMDPALGAFLERADAPDWSDREAAVGHLSETMRNFAARSHPFDEAGTRALLAQVLDRTTSPAATQLNHTRMAGGAPWRERLGAIEIPTLVVHGAEDPLFPRAHGAALAREIPGARLLVLDATGHELPRRMWGLVVPRMLELTQNPSRQASL